MHLLYKLYNLMNFTNLKVDPVTTDPKGETCSGFRVGNTPTLTIKR